MQAILTRYLPATNVRGSRIKASCDRGSITISYPHEFSGDECHREAVRQLVAKFNKEDAKTHEVWKPTPGKGWNAPFITGGLPNNGGYAHVFLPLEMQGLIAQIHANAAESPEWIRAKIESLRNLNA
jgi:hypothetical protein